MRVLITIGLVFCSAAFLSAQIDDCDGVNPNNENTDGSMGPLCTVWNACNGPYSGCQSYDLDFVAGGPVPGAPNWDGCNLNCAPIDSGVLFLLLGGGLFGGMMLMRRRESDLTPLVSKD